MEGERRRRGRGAEQQSTIEKWKRLAQGEIDERRKALYGSLSLVFADLADRKAIWEEGLRGWNMRESTVVNEWKNEGKAEERTEGILEILERRFPPGASPELTMAIRANKDLTTLRQWWNAAWTVASIDEFFKLVRS